MRPGREKRTGNKKAVADAHGLMDEIGYSKLIVARMPPGEG